MRRLLLILCLILPTGVAWALDPWAGCDFLTAGAGITIVCPNTTTGGATITSGGSSGAAPADATYWVSSANATLTNEVSLGLLTTGLIRNTVSAGVGTPSTYPGSVCSSGTFVNAIAANGDVICTTGGGGAGTLTGTGTSPNIAIWASATALTNYAGSSCGNGTFASSISANGTLTCYAIASTITVSAGTGISVSGSPVSLGGTVTVSGSTAALRRVCAMIVGADDGAVLVNANLGPQGQQCFIPYAASVVEINVMADGGGPSVIVGKRHASGTATNLLSSALSTNISGLIACSSPAGGTGLNGVTTCLSSVQSNNLPAGTTLELVSGTAGGTAKRMSIFVIYTVN